MTDAVGTPLRSTLGEAATMRVDELGDIDPTATVRQPSFAASNVGALDQLRALSEDRSQRLNLAEEIGRGGMGVVLRAEQVALRRAVAVKRLRADTRAPEAADALLLEAWVLGALEHPNVVPVHDLTIDDSGDPVMVLKRIEGESWEQLLGDDAGVRAKFAADDVLEWHLGVLVSVCNAVAFAHKQGIVHRDIKPENVMVGRYGEVYVVDWGIAVSIGDEPVAHIPRAEQVSGFAGTPCYMAPEMLGGPGARITPRTDVYLLGATLFHVLSGDPPHRGASLLQIAAELVDGPPPLPPDTPPRLVEVCQRAMATEPAERFASVDELRAAIVDFLRHRDAMLLADEGEAKLAELIELGRSETDDPEAHRLAMFNKFSEARLGFRLAKRMWPASEQAADGVTRALVVMIDYLLTQEDLSGAVTLSRQLEDVPASLAVRLQRARAEDETQRRRVLALEELGRDLDPSVGHRSRFIAYAALAVQFIGVEVVAHFWRPLETDAGLIGGTGFVLAIVMGVGLVFRDVMWATVLNRHLFASVAFAFAAKLLGHIVVALLGLEPWVGHILGGIAYCAMLGLAAATQQSKLFPVAIAFAAATVGSAAVPDYRYLMFAAAGCVMLATLAVIHRDDSSADEPSGTPDESD